MSVKSFFAASTLVAWVSFLAMPARADLWCTGYLPGKEQSTMPASAIDYTIVTHVIHFALIPNADGTLNSEASGISPANSASLAASAHGAGRKVLICVGGAGSEPAFQAATTSAILPVFVRNLTNFVAARGYDGVDLDWEPLTAADSPQFTNLVNRLRSALDNLGGHKLLTAAVGAYPPYGDPPTFQYSLFAGLQNSFDQINVMTYDMAGPYVGWVTWFNSPIFDNGYRFPSTGTLVPSIDGSISAFVNNGVLPEKLGIGVAFYGYVWTGGRGTNAGGLTLPRQSWASTPKVTTPPYSKIMDNYYSSNCYRWDTAAQAAYLSISNANPANDMFISYDDPHSCEAKVDYARNRGLGGVMIWQLAQDHRSGQKADVLLESLKQAVRDVASSTISHPYWLRETAQTNSITARKLSAWDQAP